VACVVLQGSKIVSSNQFKNPHGQNMAVLMETEYLISTKLAVKSHFPPKNSKNVSSYLFLPRYPFKRMEIAKTLTAILQAKQLSGL